MLFFFRYFCNMSNEVIIRPYNPSDKALVLALFKLNVPEYFAESEIEDLNDYLENEIEQYFVAEIQHELVGAGGINFEDDEKIGKISWDFIHPTLHGKGIGKMLLKHRISILKANKKTKQITVRTSQFASGFYEKNGFVLKKVVKDYWAKGFDLYYMLLR